MTGLTKKMQGLVLVFLLTFGVFGLLVSCGGGGGGGAAVILGSIYTPGVDDPDPTTRFVQFVPPVSPEEGVFPGAANMWDIQDDFALDDGGDDQFDDALFLITGATYFPSQAYSDLTFYTPLMDANDGLVPVVVSDGTDLTPSFTPPTGTYSAIMAPSAGTVFSRTIDLTGATGTVTAQWTDIIGLYSGEFSPFVDVYSVVVRDTSAVLLETLYTTGVSSVSAVRAFNISSHAGNVVVLSFELTSNVISWGSNNYTVIDDVSVVDSGAGGTILTDGFEDGDIAGWSSDVLGHSQNFKSAVELIETLDVQRSFYTTPNSLWGRWTDTFTNNTGGTIIKTITYNSNLGSDYSGIIYDTPGANGMAITTWDGDNSDRDAGFVFGNADTVDYTSDDGLGNGNGSDNIDFTYDITVPAGESVTIVNFIVMNGTDTGNAAGSIADLATEVDAENLNIVDDFWSNPIYRDGMLQSEIDNIWNF